MIDVKNEMRYILVTRLLEQAAEAGLLSAEELWAAKRLALESRRPIGSCPLYFRYKGKGALDILNFTLA